MDKEMEFITDLLGQFLAKENPQTIANILSRLDTTLTAVLSRLPNEMQGEVVFQLFQLRVGDFGLLRWTANDLGGIRNVAEILNRSSGATESNVLNYLDSHDPVFAEEVRNNMFVFEDIANMSNQDIQQVVSVVDAKDLAVALKGCGEELKDRFLSNLADAELEEVQAEIASSGPVRVRDVEEIRLGIVRTVRRLEERGKATIVRGEGDYIL